jgi:flagellar basal-body rod protein FlgC
MPVSRLLLPVALAFAAWGCASFPGGGRPSGAGGGNLVVDTAGAPRTAGRGAARVALLDPLDWSARFLEANGLKVERRDGAVVLVVEDPDRAAEPLAGALLALRRRMAVIAENVANAETTRLPSATPDDAAQPYRRKVLAVAAGGTLEVTTDPSPFRKSYRPNHPDANKDGQVLLPNVYVAVEMADWRASLREYETLRLALASLSGRYVAPPAELLPVPVPPPPYEEKSAPAPKPEVKPIPAPTGPKTE